MLVCHVPKFVAILWPGFEWNYSKMKFPSNMNCDGKIAREIGPVVYHGCNHSNSLVTDTLSSVSLIIVYFMAALIAQYLCYVIWYLGFYLSLCKYGLTKYIVSIPSLTHWGRVTHICVSKLTIIGSDNGLSPGRRQAIIWTNAGIMLIGSLGTNLS